MKDQFTVRKFKWLEQVATDVCLPPSAVRVAVILALRYLNREKGFAWPAVGTLASDLSMSLRGVQKAVKALTNGGHLLCRLGGGRRKTNHYSIVVLGEGTSQYRGQEDRCASIGGNDNEPGTPVHLSDAETANVNAEKPRTPVRPNPMNEHNEKDYISNRFLEFWKHYPLKKARGHARSAFERAVRDGTDPNAIILGAMRYSAECAEREVFIMFPAKWLTGECWLDEPLPPLPGDIRTLHGGRNTTGEVVATTLNHHGDWT